MSATSMLTRKLSPTLSCSCNDASKNVTRNPNAAKFVRSLRLLPSRCSFTVTTSGEDTVARGVADYNDYRKTPCVETTHKALLVDAVGTLVVPSQPTAEIYKKIGEKYGVKYSENEILHRFRRAYGQPWYKSRLRYENDGRPFWRHVVSSSTGCSDPHYFEELYGYYSMGKAWRLCDCDAEKVFSTLRKVGVKLVVVSNFDTRLRPLLHALRCDHWFDALAISAEVEAEKPNPMIFLKACELIGVKPEDAVHVGDDRRNDVWGARDAGCHAWLWGSDVHSFMEVAEKMGISV